MAKCGRPIRYPWVRYPWVCLNCRSPLPLNREDQVCAACRRRWKAAGGGECHTPAPDHEERLAAHAARVAAEMAALLARGETVDT